MSAPLRLFDHHIHSHRSDGGPTLEERARSVALRPHGISDHYPWRDKMRDDDDVLRYQDDAACLGLRVGIEYDLGVAPPLLESTRRSLDYLIGSVHQVELDGVRIGFDVAGRYVKGLFGDAPYPERERFADPSLRRRILERTLAIVAEGIATVGIQILGHPTFGPLQALGDPEDAYPVEWQERLIELCVASDVALEVNESYGVPHPAFLRRAQARGALFSVGSDTHGALGPLDRTARMIAEAGLPHGRFLDRGRRPGAAAQAAEPGGSAASSS